MVKVELVGDGNGHILVFINGCPQGQYYAAYSLPDTLERLLQTELCECKPTSIEDA